MCNDCEDMMWEAGKKFERERIIALFPPCPDMGDANTCTCQMYFADEIIALINGEVDA